MTPKNKRASKQPEDHDGLFLPSFCDIRLVFAVVVIAELLAFVLVLAAGGQRSSRWTQLGIVSLFVQWVGLSSAAVLCLARPLLRRVSNTLAASLSYALLLLVALVLSEMAYQVTQLRPAMWPMSLGGHVDFLLRNFAISAVISAMVLRYLYVQHQWKCQVQAQAQARFEALQARIRPHFLFNSLNTIASLVASRPTQAEQAVEDLADVFRACLTSGSDHLSLDKELEIARRYVNVESLRLGERLQVDWQISDLPQSLSVPALIVQPLLENAIYHGIETLPQGGTVTVAGDCQQDRVTLAVTNPVAPSNGHQHHAGKRMALDNIRQRLQLAFGAKAGLDVEISEAQFTVRLTIPREVD